MNTRSAFSMKTVCLMVLLSVGVLVSCDEQEKYSVSFDYDRFVSERAQWQDLNIRNYSYTYYSPGFIPMNVRVTVADGEYQSSTSLDGSPAENFDYTVNDILSSIESHYLAEKGKEYTEEELFLKSIEIEYDPLLHIPTKVFYNYNIPEGWEVDGNDTFYLKDFVQ